MSTENIILLFMPLVGVLVVGGLAYWLGDRDMVEHDRKR